MNKCIYVCFIFLIETMPSREDWVRECVYNQSRQR